MRQFILASMLLLGCSVGCSMCCGPFDNDYGTFGGKHTRADRSHGRVGSILSDPVVSLYGPSADSNLTPPPEPSVQTIDDDDEDTLDIDLDRDEDDLDDLDRDLDDLDRDVDDLDRDEDLFNGTKDIDLEPIEPLENEAGEDSTASSRWRPRPLR